MAYPIRDWAAAAAVDDSIIYFSIDARKYSFLSNMYIHPIRLGKFHYGSAEAAFQAQKFVNRPDGEATMRLFLDTTPKQAKRLGGPRGRIPRMTPEEVEDWSTRRVDVMRRILGQKFEDPDLRERLLATGDRKLVERIMTGRGGDSFWGTTKAKGRGCNVLGCMLMEIRREIMAK